MASDSPIFLPPGYRFYPKDIELVRDYLYPKIMGTLSPLFHDSVTDCDLYGPEEPWEVWDRFKGVKERLNEKDFFFFTYLKKKTANGSRIDRKVGSSQGTWQGEATKRDQLNFQGNDGRLIMGIKKRFSYRNRKSKQDGHWILMEYSLCLPNTDCVLCILRKSDRCSYSNSVSDSATNKKAVVTEEPESLNLSRKRKSANCSFSTNNDDSSDTANQWPYSQVFDRGKNVEAAKRLRVGEIEYQVVPTQQFYEDRAVLDNEEKEHEAEVGGDVFHESQFDDCFTTDWMFEVLNNEPKKTEIEGDIGHESNPEQPCSDADTSLAAPTSCVEIVEEQLNPSLEQSEIYNVLKSCLEPSQPQPIASLSDVAAEESLTEIPGSHVEMMVDTDPDECSACTWRNAWTSQRQYFWQQEAGILLASS